MRKCAKCGKMMKDNKSWEVYQDSAGTFYNWRIDRDIVTVIGAPAGIELKKVYLGYDCYGNEFYKK